MGLTRDRSHVTLTLFPASTITIISSTITLARLVNQLIQNVKEHDKNTEELGCTVDTLTIILRQIPNLYGLDESQLRSPDEQEIRSAVRDVVVRCNKDLTRLSAKLKQLLRHGSWASKAWKQQFIAPALARIEKTLSERQSRLNMLVQLLQGSVTTCQLEQGLSITANLISRHQLEQLRKGLPTLNQEDGDSNTSLTLINTEELEDYTFQEPTESGIALLEAIEMGDTPAFESLLSDGDTSFQEKDDKGRNPLLLAAYLGKESMIQKLVAAGSMFSALPSDNATRVRASSSPSVVDRENSTNFSKHRELDMNATDNLGRTALHYCAEFGMCKAATLLLDHSVNVNARDSGDHPPAYYASKNRKYFAVELLLKRGASTDFERPITSAEIKKLLEKGLRNYVPASASGPE